MADEPPDDEDGQRLLVPRLTEAHFTDGGIPFTPTALSVLNQQVAEYAADLIDEAGRVARRRRSAEIVSASDVERAIEDLGLQPRRRRAQVISAFGSLLLGAALGNVLQIAGLPTVAPESAILTFVCGVAGAGMMTYGFLRD